ncbi:universal stress protein [uncultured Methanobrevibacter sp.]|uniref:universal stress protein n=1 Tax=uncultured Methanobrevibacter sp. TaxID=253161 RepID=UPI0025DE5826|nr:universal stress protein [uncultured Methanobrevibacter sp.]
MFEKILLPTDGSEFSELEVERAIKALADDGEIIILSVAHQLKATTPFQSKKDIESMNKKLAKKFKQHVKVKKMVIPGLPSETIIRVAEEEDVDLIIIAASGKSGLHRFFIGSVAEKVLKNSERDVLLIHN